MRDYMSSNLKGVIRSVLIDILNEEIDFIKLSNNKKTPHFNFLKIKKYKENKQLIIRLIKAFIFYLSKKNDVVNLQESLKDIQNFIIYAVNEKRFKDGRKKNVFKNNSR